MNYETLTTNQRVNRVLFGFAVITFTMLVNVTPLGWFAVLPLVATYPIFSGIYGHDPLSHAVRQALTAISRVLHWDIGSQRSKHV